MCVKLTRIVGGSIVVGVLCNRYKRGKRIKYSIHLVLEIKTEKLEISGPLFIALELIVFV